MPGKDEGIQTKVSMLGSKEYKADLSEISRGMAVLTSDAKATATAFAGQENSVAALTEKQKNLQQQYDLHQKKVALINAQMEISTEKYGANSKQTQDLQIQLNNAQAAMNKVGTALGDTTTALGAAEAAEKKMAEGGGTLQETLEGSATKSAALDQQLRDVERSLKNGATSTDTLAEKQSLLQQKTQAQGEACDALQRAYDESVASSGAFSTESIELNKQLQDQKDKLDATQKQLDTTTAALDAAAEASQSMGAEAEDAAKGVDKEGEEAGDSAKETGKWKDALSDAGKVLGDGFVAGAKAAAAAIAAVGSAAAAAVGAGFEFSKSAAAMADNILTLSTQTSIGTDTLQKWSYASELIDVPVETMTGSMAKMIKQMGAADKGSESTAAKFKALGVNIYDSNGKLRDSEAVFFDCIDALGNVGNETERDALAMEIFGKKAQDLNPLIVAGADKLKDLGEEGEAMGAVFSGDALDAMGSFDDSMQRFNATGEGLKNTIGLLLIPAFQPLMDVATSTMADVSNALKDGLQPGEMETIITNLTTNIGGAMTQVTGLITEAIPIITSALSGVVGLLVEQLPGLMNELLPAAFGLLQSVLDAIVANVEPITSLAVNLVTSIATFLLENVGLLLDAAVGIVTGLVDGITEKLPELIPLAVTMLINLATSLVEAIPELTARLPEIVTAIWEGLAAVDWIGLGMNLIEGLVNGLNSAVDSLLESIKNVFVGIWNAILGVFGIASPSTEAKSAAGFILDGLLEGFSSAVDAVCETVKRIFGKIWDAIKSIFGFGSQSEESKEAKSAGKDIMTGMQSGITENEETLKNAVSNVSKAVLEKFKTELGIEGNTSSKTKPYGQATAVGINDGMKDKAQPGTFGGANDLATAAGSALNTAFGIAGTGLLGMGEKSASKFEYVGKAVAQGVAKGITDNKSLITSAATAAAQAAYDAAKNQLGIKSPSRVMAEIGMYYDQGFAGGIRENMHEVMAAASDLSSMAARSTAANGAMRSEGAAIDYAQLADAVTEAMERRGLGSLMVDGRELGTAVEPSVSQATRRRSGQSVTGRTSRMVLA